MESVSRSRRPRDRVVAPSVLGPLVFSLPAITHVYHSLVTSQKHAFTGRATRGVLVSIPSSAIRPMDEAHQRRVGDIQMPDTVQKITPFLWFDTQAEEAAKFYASLFRYSRIVGTTYYAAEAAKASGRPEGSVMTVEFELSGQRFTALNGGP